MAGRLISAAERTAGGDEKTWPDGDGGGHRRVRASPSDKTCHYIDLGVGATLPRPPIASFPAVFYPGTNVSSSKDMKGSSLCQEGLQLARKTRGGAIFLHSNQ